MDYRLKNDTLRPWIIRNMSPVIFLAAFFLTVVLGNLLFATPFGRAQLQKIPSYAIIYNFPTIFTPLYWLLLFLPFLMTPIMVILVRRYLEKPVHRLCARVPEIRRIDYLVIAGLALGHVGYHLWKANAFSLYGTGTDAVSSVEIRFQILSGLRFWTMAVLMSILPFLAVYAQIRWIRSSALFWKVTTVVVASLVALYMVLLNMKWPFLVFAAALILTVFAHSQRRPYIKAGIGTVALFATYLVISSHVFRYADSSSNAPPPELAAPSVIAPEASAPGTPPHTLPEVRPNKGVLSEALDTPKLAFTRAPETLFSGLTRMAILYPFYYQVFTEEGYVCGGILAQARVGPACRPSTYIYTRVFGRDGFEGRGTAPAAVHISGYSLGGWPIALFAMVCASIVMALITCLPITASATVGAFGIMGAVAGYHFSQVPGEGPIFYDHGLIWTLIPVVIYSILRWIFRDKRSEKRGLPESM